VHLSIFISVIDQLDAQNFCFKISLFHASTCFEHMCTYRCDDTRGCVIHFWPSADEHMCSKHVEAWNKLIVKQKCCASSWLITEIKNYLVASSWHFTLFLGLLPSFKKVCSLPFLQFDWVPFMTHSGSIPSSLYLNLIVLSSCWHLWWNLLYDRSPDHYYLSSISVRPVTNLHYSSTYT